MICPNCKTKNEDGAVYCENCGTRLSEKVKKEAKPQPEEPKKEAKPKKTVKAKKENKVKTEAPESGYKSAKGIITTLSVLIVVMALALGVGLWQNNAGAGNSESASVVTEEDDSDSAKTTEKTTEKATTEEKKEEEEDLPDIEAKDTVDYSKVLTLSAYETFSADGYSFAYPKDFYKKVSSTDNGYRFESDDEHEWLEYSKEKVSGSQSTSEAISSIRSGLMSRLTERNDILYKESSGLCIMGGVEKSDKEQAIYYLSRVQGNYIYTMEIGYGYPGTSPSTEKNQKDYYVDCLYRYCSFAGGSYKPRSYSMFLDDDMGTKK